MNPYNYLFYKIARFLNKDGGNEWGSIGAITLIIGWNIMVAYITILPINRGNFDGKYKIILIILLVSLFIFNSLFFLNKKREGRIIKRYGKESKTSKKIGSFLVVLYAILSLGVIFFI